MSSLSLSLPSSSRVVVVVVVVDEDDDCLDDDDDDDDDGNDDGGIRHMISNPLYRPSKSTPHKGKVGERKLQNPDLTIPWVVSIS